MKARKYLLFFLIVLPQSNAVTLQSTTEIPPVIVKAHKKIQYTLSDGPKVVLSKKQWNTTGIATLSQALQNLGGLQLRDTTGNGSQVAMNLRGFGSNATSNVLLLINDIPITNPDLAPPNLNLIPLSEIEYIEIVAGSESVLYGDQAVGGIINIVTKHNLQEKIEAACSAGSYNHYYCYAAIANHFEPIRFSLLASSNKTDNYRDHNDYDQNVVTGFFDVNYSTGRISFNYNLANEDMQYPGALTAAQVRQNRRQANNRIDFFTDWSGFFLLRHQHALNANWLIDTNIARREMHGHGVLTSAFNQSRQIYFIKQQLKSNVGLNKIVMGLDAQTDYYHLSSLFGLTNNHQQKYSLFAIANLPILTSTVSLGGRIAQQNSQLESFNDNQTINRAIATNIGLSIPLNLDIDFYARRAESFRFPKADENAFAPIGVSNLRTQRGVAYETGFKWLKTTYSGKVGFYLLNLRDEIAFDPTQTPQQPFGANRNLAPTVRRGFTLSQKNNITNRLSLGGQYNYVYARFKNGINAGNRIPLVSETILLINVNYQFLENWHFYTEAIYTGSQFPANDDANIGGSIGGYTVVNVNLRYQFKHLEASFRINNVFNKLYYFYTIFQSNTWQESFYPAPERNVLLTFKYSFL